MFRTLVTCFVLAFIMDSALAREVSGTARVRDADKIVSVIETATMSCIGAPFRAAERNQFNKAVISASLLGKMAIVVTTALLSSSTSSAVATSSVRFSWTLD